MLGILGFVKSSFVCVFVCVKFELYLTGLRLLLLTHFCSNYFVIYHQNKCFIFETVGKMG